MTHYFKIPFAVSGDKTAVPATTGDGTVNYTDGYGADYSLPRSTDPAALNVERRSMNQLFNDITTALKQYQEFGIPLFVTTSDNGGTPFSYSNGALVRYDNGTTTEVYMSLTNLNTALPTDTMYWVMLSGIITATQAQANIAVAASGYQWNYLTATTSSDPTSGKLKFNNATLSSATALYISETTALAQVISADISTWDDSTSTIHGQLRMVQRANPAIFALFNITGTITDNGTWDTITVAYVAGSGSFANNDLVSTQFVRTGDKGDTGAPVADGDKGDVTVSSTGTVWTIDANTIDAARLQSDAVTTIKILDANVTNVKLATVATGTFKGRTTAGTGAVEDLTATQATALLNPFTSSLKGLVPASAGGTTNFLRADATFAKPSFTPDYESAQTDAGIGTNIQTFAHSLGSIPSLVQAFLICQTTEAGYAVGEWIPCNQSGYNVGFGMASRFDATNVKVTGGSSGFNTVNATTGASANFAITGANGKLTNWKLVVRAWK